MEAHIFLCVLAYHLLISIEKTLLDQGMHTSWATVRGMLKTHQVATVVLPSEGALELRIRRCSVPEQRIENSMKSSACQPKSCAQTSAGSPLKDRRNSD